MRRTSLYIFWVVILLAIFFSTAIGVQVPVIAETIHNKDLGELEVIKSPLSPIRLKRQVESFDVEYATTSTPETEDEPGFWEKFVKVALKIVNKFIEWLNS